MAVSLCTVDFEPLVGFIVRRIISVVYTCFKLLVLQLDFMNAKGLFIYDVPKCINKYFSI